MNTFVTIAVYAGFLSLPFVGGHSGHGVPHPPKPITLGERTAMENHTREHPDFPLKYVGRPFSAVGNAYKTRQEKNPVGFTESRTLGADVFCANLAGPILYGEQIKVTGVLQSPVFTWDEGTKTFYLKDCVLSR
jgi:hypothetical protein